MRFHHFLIHFPNLFVFYFLKEVIRKRKKKIIIAIPIPTFYLHGHKNVLFLLFVIKWPLLVMYASQTKLQRLACAQFPNHILPLPPCLEYGMGPSLPKILRFLTVLG